MDGQPTPGVPPVPPAVPAAQFPPAAPPQFPPLPQRAIPLEPPPGPPKRRLGAWLLGGGIVLLCVVGASVLTWNYAQSRRISQRDDSVNQKYKDSAGAFTDAPAAADASDPNAEAERTAIVALFDRFGAAVKAADNVAVKDCFDGARMFRELERLGTMPTVPLTRQREAADGLQTGIARGIANQPADYQWDRYELRRIKPLDVPGEAVVYVRDWRPDGVSVKTRWWVKKRGGTWRFYDMEVLDAGFRLTTAASTFAAAGPGLNLPALQRAVQEIRTAGASLLQWDAPAAEKSLTALDSYQANLPPQIDAIRHVLWAELRIQQKRPAEAMTHLDQAVALHSDLPAATQTRAWALNELGRHEEALSAAKASLDTLGADAVTYGHMARAHLGLGKPDEARAYFLKALADEPDYPDAWAGICTATTDGPGKAELAREFGKVKNPSAVFQGAAFFLVDRGQADGLDTLLSLYEPRGADDPWLPFYKAHALMNREKFADAAALLAENVSRAPAESQAAFEELRRSAMLAGGDYVAAYEASTDRAAGFLTMASAAAGQRDAAALRKLIAAHRAGQPRDPWLHYFEGHACRFEGRNDDALAAFARGRLVAEGEEAQEDFRREQVSLLFEAGKVLEAYRTVGPRDATFSQLGWSCFIQGKSEDMARLVAEHRTAEPRDAELPMWDAHVAYLRRDYTEAAKLYRRYRAAAGQEGRPVHDQLIRSLLRAGRTDEARAEAQAALRDRNDSYYLAMVHLAAGEFDEAVVRMDRYLEEGGAPFDLYDDPDMGSLLKGADALAAWRAKHPEPAPAPAGAAPEGPAQPR